MKAKVTVRKVQMCYQDMIDLLKSCMDHIESFEDDMTLDVFHAIGFSDEQIKSLGFEHLLDVEE